MSVYPHKSFIRSSAPFHSPHSHPSNPNPTPMFRSRKPKCIQCPLPITALLTHPSVATKTPPANIAHPSILCPTTPSPRYQIARVLNPIVISRPAISRMQPYKSACSFGTVGVGNWKRNCPNCGQKRVLQPITVGKAAMRAAAFGREMEDISMVLCGLMGVLKGFGSYKETDVWY